MTLGISLHYTASSYNQSYMGIMCLMPFSASLPSGLVLTTWMYLVISSDDFFTPLLFTVANIFYLFFLNILDQTKLYKTTDFGQINELQKYQSNVDLSAFIKVQLMGSEQGCIMLSDNR